jgi:hypothetical protein
MSVLDAVVDMLKATQQQGKWADGQRFFVQVRAYLGSQVFIRLFNMDTGVTCDRIYDLATGQVVAEQERATR